MKIIETKILKYALALGGLVLFAPATGQTEVLAAITQEKDVVRNEVRDKTVEYLSQRVQKLSEKLDDFEADVQDGPNSAQDNIIKDKIEHLSKKADEVKKSVEDLQNADRRDFWIAKKEKTVAMLDNLEAMYKTISSLNKNLR